MCPCSWNVFVCQHVNVNANVNTTVTVKLCVKVSLCTCLCGERKEAKFQAKLFIKVPGLSVHDKGC